MSTFVCPYCGGRVKVEMRFRAETELKRRPVNAELGGPVLEAICGLGRLGRLDEEGALWREEVTVKCVAEAATALLKAEGREDLGEGLKPRKVGEVIRRVLRLETMRSSPARRAYVVVWDEAAIGKLRERFGVDEERLGEVVRILEDLRERLNEAV